MSEKVKGDKHGLCNRSACQSSVNVVFYNKSTCKYYCRICAELINTCNKSDSIRLYGTKHLCEEVEDK